MNRVYVKTAKIEVLEELPNGDVRVQNFMDNSDIWVIPRDIFKKTYREDSSLYVGCFGRAIQAMEQGYKVSRQGWNSKDMWITISDNLQGKPLEADKFWNPHSKQAAIDNGGSMEVLPTIIMKTADNKILMGWLASQTDMLAKDWEIVL